MSDVKKLGEVLRDARIAVKLTRRQVARRLKRSPNHVADVEQGWGSLSVEDLEHYLDAVRITEQEQRWHCYHLLGVLPKELQSWISASPENLAAVCTFVKKKV